MTYGLTGYRICFFIGLFAYRLYSSQTDAAHLRHPVKPYRNEVQGLQARIILCEVLR